MLTIVMTNEYGGVQVNSQSRPHTNGISITAPNSAQMQNFLFNIDKYFVQLVCMYFIQCLPAFHYMYFSLFHTNCMSSVA